MKLPGSPSLGFVLLFSLLLGNFPLAAQSEQDDSSNIVASYPVREGVLAGKPTGDHLKIWSGVKALIPSSVLNLVDTLEFFQVPADQKDEEVFTDAYATLNENGTTFTLGLNLDSAVSALVNRDPDSRPDFQKTILHEFGHVLSFQPSQRDDTGTVTGTLVVDEGTLKPGAYLNLFYDKFWKTTFPRHGSVTTSDAEGTDLFNKNPASFVTEYAATGPMEDFAETFAYFVTNPPPSGKSVKDQKLRFFAGFPELVILREQMRKGL